MVERRKAHMGKKEFENIKAFIQGGKQPHDDAPQFIGQPSPPLPTYGRGFFRMKERLGPERAEELRQEVLKDQLAARAKWGGQPVNERDRATYAEYPRSNQKSKRRKK